MKGIIYFDIDGTLVDSDHGDHLPSPSSREAIRLAKENGYLCMISSGRSLAGLSGYRNIGMDGYIFADGAGYLLEGEEPVTVPISQEVLSRLIPQVTEEFGGEMLMSSMDSCYASEGQYKIMKQYIDAINQSIRDSGSTDFARMYPLAEHTDDPILEIDVSFGSPAEETEWLKHLDPALEYISTTASYGRNGGSAGEVTAKGMTKGHRCMLLAEQLRIAPEDTYAFGDSMNDASMLRACGHGIAMGNAAEELKEIAEYVTDAVDQDGIYNAMMHYGIIGEEE